MRAFLVGGIILSSFLALNTAASPPTPCVSDFTVPARTSAPFTYCAWYLADPTAPAFLDPLAASPPDLFHLGYQIPFKGALGPTYGHELFTDAILPPEEIPREAARIKDLIKKMREAGVQRIIPYVYTMAFFGNPEKRTGFFRFFDHWDEYRAFGLGPKPPGDPTLWSQVPGPQPLGGGPPDVLHYNPCINHPAWREYLDLVVRQLAGVGYDGMFFDVNTLYCYCPYCEAGFDVYLFEKYGPQGLRDAFGTDDTRELNLSRIYRDFEDTILKGFKEYLVRIWDREHLAEILGIFDASQAKLDEDWRLLRCYMHQSVEEYPPREGFDHYLKTEFAHTRVDGVAPEEREAFIQAVLRHHFQAYLESEELASVLKARFGSADIRRRCCGTQRDLLLWVETERFWCDSMAGLFARLKTVGRETLREKGNTGDFFTVANLGSMNTVDGLDKRRVDGIDLVRWAPMADMQMFEEMPQAGSLESGVIISNIFAFRWAMAAGTRAGTLLYKVTDDTAADLANAEAAAGGGGAFIQGQLAAPESRNRWKRFFAEHRDLWEGGESLARVGLLFWSDQVFYEYPEHLAMVYRLVSILSETQVPFDIVTEQGIGTLARYDVVIAPMLRYLDPPQAEALLAYAHGGGNLVVIEPFAADDKWARPAPGDILSRLRSAEPGMHAAPHGNGRILILPADAVPKRQSDLWNLMEERGGDFARARQYLDNARREDIRNRLDLGAKFVADLGTCLGKGLRWCASSTDPGVFIHAYLLPETRERDARVVVHLVNYRVPIRMEKEPKEGQDAMWAVVTKSGPPSEQQDLEITIPLPDHVRIRGVTSSSPTEPPGQPTCRPDANCARIGIQQLKLYKAIVIELEHDGEKPNHGPGEPSRG